MPTLLNKKFIAVILIIATVLVNIISRQYSGYVFNRANSICFFILSVTAFLVSKDVTRAVSFLFASYMLYMVIETFNFHPMEFQSDDIVAIPIVIGATLIYAWLNKPSKMRLGVDSILLLLALTVKIVTQYTYYHYTIDNVDYWLAIQGDITAQLLLSGVLLTFLIDFNIEVPVVFFAIVYLRWSIEILGNPNQWNIFEIRVLAFLGIIILWWVVYRYFYRKKIMLHILFASSVLFAAICLFKYI